MRQEPGGDPDGRQRGNAVLTARVPGSGRPGRHGPRRTWWLRHSPLSTGAEYDPANTRTSWEDGRWDG
ncbi:hypothetical protein GCM10020295_11550 [Streptomyces cinereospinus]